MRSTRDNRHSNCVPVSQEEAVSGPPAPLLSLEQIRFVDTDAAQEAGHQDGLE